MAAKDPEPTVEETRTIFVRMDNKVWKKVENIPANAKVTFGKMHAGKPENGGWSPSENCLRIYTAGDNQLAVFVGVKEFLDSTLQVSSKTIAEDHRNMKNKRKDGVTEMETNETVIEEWTNENF